MAFEALVAKDSRNIPERYIQRHGGSGHWLFDKLRSHADSLENREQFIGTLNISEDGVPRPYLE
jgi:hypothetical protein